MKCKVCKREIENEDEEVLGMHTDCAIDEGIMNEYYFE